MTSFTCPYCHSWHSEAHVHEGYRLDNLDTLWIGVACPQCGECLLQHEIEDLNTKASWHCILSSHFYCVLAWIFFFLWARCWLS